MITGNEIKPNDKLVGLKENGFRSNGLSLVRKIMERKHGDEWHKVKFGVEDLGDLVLCPSRIYSKAVVDMFGGFDGEQKAKIHGIAHITGGGIPGKLSRVIKPNGLGADIYDPFDPCELMIHCQKHGDVTDEEAYETWNMGQGMIIITPEPKEVIKVAGTHNIESKVIGKVNSRGEIRIESKGLNLGRSGELIY